MGGFPETWNDPSFSVILKGAESSFLCWRQTYNQLSNSRYAATIFAGIHISSRQVVRDAYKVLRTSIKNRKLVRWTSKF